MSDNISVTFLDQTGAKTVKARIAPTVTAKKMIPMIITKMSLPATAPDGTPMSYSLDHKEGGKRLLEDQTLGEANVREGDHLIVYPEIVAGAETHRCTRCQSRLWDYGWTFYPWIPQPGLVSTSEYWVLCDTCKINLVRIGFDLERDKLAEEVGTEEDGELLVAAHVAYKRGLIAAAQSVCRLCRTAPPVRRADEEDVPVGDRTWEHLYHGVASCNVSRILALLEAAGGWKPEWPLYQLTGELKING